MQPWKTVFFPYGLLSPRLFHFCGGTTILYKAELSDYLLWCVQQGRVKSELGCRTKRTEQRSEDWSPGRAFIAQWLKLCRELVQCAQALGFSPSTTNTTKNGQKPVGVPEMLMHEEACSCFWFVPFYYRKHNDYLFCLLEELIYFICDFVYSHFYNKSITLFLWFLPFVLIGIITVTTYCLFFMPALIPSRSYCILTQNG